MPQTNNHYISTKLRTVKKCKPPTYLKKFFNEGVKLHKI